MTLMDIQSMGPSVKVGPSVYMQGPRYGVDISRCVGVRAWAWVLAPRWHG